MRIKQISNISKLRAFGRAVEVLAMIKAHVLAWVVILPVFCFADEPPTSDPIDWDRAKALYQRDRAGEHLSPDEQAYLDRAKAQRQNGQAGRGNAANAGRPNGQAGRGDPSIAKGETTGYTPLTNKSDAKYKDYTFGLYGDGQNTPPAEHLKHAMTASKQIQPLNQDGKPAADGKIVIMSVGMSNTTQEFSQFVRDANADPAKSDRVTIVDAAQGGRAADEWSSRDRTQTWTEADRRLGAAGVSPAQVQALWIKQARRQPASLGEFPKHAQALEEDLKNIVLIARERYPQLKIVYLSSRTYAGYATTPLNPEPYAYESAFSVQSLIRSQFTGDDKSLAYDKAPVLLWGPYLWTDGTTGRTEDKLTWTKSDTAADGTHPSRTGQEKVAQLLLNFLKSDPTAKPWFAKADGK